ncbi:MAG: VOC family protein, partial [Acidimicrobiia bacterium]
MAFHPYLFFGGNCRDAFRLYEEVFGGELQLMSLGDAPGDEAPPGDPDMILHASLTFDGHLLMGSDDPMNDDFGPVQGMMVAYSAPDEDQARRVFGALSEGGKVLQELTPTFFSP